MYKIQKKNYTSYNIDLLAKLRLAQKIFNHNIVANFHLRNGDC